MKRMIFVLPFFALLLGASTVSAQELTLKERTDALENLQVPSIMLFSKTHYDLDGNVLFIEIFNEKTNKLEQEFYYYPNGKRKLYRKYREDCTLMKETFYDESGSRILTKRYREDGSLREETTYKNGQEDKTTRFKKEGESD